MVWQPTFEAVQSKLDQPLALGYCNVGVVAEIGAGVEGFAIGDRVVSNGKHAEVVCVPKNLCARVPEMVTDEQAAFTVLAAIGLQGIRLVNPTLGESVVVTGLGLIGLLTVQTAAGTGLPGARHRSRPGTAGAWLASFGAEVVDLSRGEDPLAVGGSVLARPRRGCGAHHRFDQEQRAGQPGGEDVPSARPHRAGGRDGIGAVACRLL